MIDAGWDPTICNRNCGYCGSTLLKVSQEEFLKHVNDCELRAVKRAEGPGKNPTP